MIIENFESFVGVHCETTATGNLLKHKGVEISEAMMFGLGEALSFLLFPIKGLNLPFIGGRIKPFHLTLNLCANLGLELTTKETTSKKKAWDNVRSVLDRGEPVGLQLDSYHLEYFSNKVHFAGHTVAMYGYDDTFAYLVDTAQQGGTTKTTLESLAMARSEKGPMSARNRSYSVSQNRNSIDLEKAIKNAIRHNAQQYLNPPIRNFAYKGIEKFSAQVTDWYDRCEDPTTELVQVGTFMERAGTGGSIFRNLYRDFLRESLVLVKSDAIEEALGIFNEVADEWKQCAVLFEQAGSQATPAPLHTVADVLANIAVQEKQAMEALGRL